MPRAIREFILWVVLIFICAGHRYPTLNRYNPGKQGLALYRPERADLQLKYRLPIPRLLRVVAARPLFSIAGPLLSLSAALCLSRARESA